MMTLRVKKIRFVGNGGKELDPLVVRGDVGYNPNHGIRPTFELQEVVGGAILGKAIGKGIGCLGSRLFSRSAGNIAVSFGKTNNQIYHTFRHTDALGLDRSLVKSSIETHFKSVSSQVVQGSPFNQIINVSGQRLQYTAFKLPDGTFNIGRIHGVK